MFIILTLCLKLVYDKQPGYSLVNRECLEIIAVRRLIGGLPVLLISLFLVAGYGCGGGSGSSSGSTSSGTELKNPFTGGTNSGTNTGNFGSGNTGCNTGSTGRMNTGSGSTGTKTPKLATIRFKLVEPVTASSLSVKKANRFPVKVAKGDLLVTSDKLRHL